GTVGKHRRVPGGARRLGVGREHPRRRGPRLRADPRPVRRLRPPCAECRRRMVRDRARDAPGGGQVAARAASAGVPHGAHPHRRGRAQGRPPPRRGARVTAPAFGVYLHVPFCATRCGYCDFNTYTAGELGTGASTGTYLDAIVRELELGAESLAAEGAGSGVSASALIGGGGVSGGVRPAETVFIGGGTPSLLGASGLARLL